MTIATGMGRHPVYLWTLPMFHCNGWCFPWTLSALAGTHVCLRWVRAKAMYDAIVEHTVTHLSGAAHRHGDAAPTPRTRRSGDHAHASGFNHAAAPPPQAVLGGDGAHAGFQPHPSLRPHRDLWPGRRQRVGRRVGRRSTSRAATPRSARQGVRYRRARRPHRDGPRPR